MNSFSLYKCILKSLLDLLKRSSISIQYSLIYLIFPESKNPPFGCRKKQGKKEKGLQDFISSANGCNKVWKYFRSLSPLFFPLLIWFFPSNFLAITPSINHILNIICSILQKPLREHSIPDCKWEQWSSIFSRVFRRNLALFLGKGKYKSWMIYSECFLGSPKGILFPSAQNIH